MRSEFEIKITTSSMYRFLMYHIYHSFSGVFSVVAGLGILVLFFVMRDSSQSWIYLLFGVLFLVYEPWSLYTRAVKQAKLNPVFKKPLRYTVTEQGITVTQDQTENKADWDSVLKVRETGRSIYVYTSVRNAFIWEKSQMGSETAAVKKLLETHIDSKKRKLKGQADTKSDME